MKKTLVILLALIMATSVAVTACDEETPEGADTQNQFEMDFGDDTSSDVITDESGNVITDTNNDAGDDDTSNNSGSSSGNQIVNEPVYVLYNATIRQKSSKNATNNSADLGTVPFGACVTRTEKNDYWSKITYTTSSGSTVEGWILNQLVTTNQKTVNFKAPELTPNEDGTVPTALVTKLDASSTPYRLRYYPLANGYPHKVTVELGEKGQVDGGVEVTVLEISEDNMWAKIRVKAGALNIKDDQGRYKKDSTNPKYSTEDAEGYVPVVFLEIGASNSGSSQPDGPSAG